MADADAKPADADARDVVYIESPWGGTMAIERKQGSDLERFNSAYQVEPRASGRGACATTTHHTHARISLTRARRAGSNGAPVDRARRVD
jgi:hypothetical protein